MLKTTLAAAAIVIAFGLPAHAIPASSPAPLISGAKLDPIQVRKDRHRHKRANRHHRRHWHGHRHGHRHWHAPRYRGWHRYHSRPWNWRSRGCVVVGPVWFCP